MFVGLIYDGASLDQGEARADLKIWYQSTALVSFFPSLVDHIGVILYVPLNFAFSRNTVI
jgi:hypothetical protein